MRIYTFTSWTNLKIKVNLKASKMEEDKYEPKLFRSLLHHWWSW